MSTGFTVDNYWTPSDIETQVWLDASDASTITSSGGLVSQWDDKSGNDNHATQTSDTEKPTTGTETINSLNTLHFDSDGDLLDINLAITDEPYNLFIVAECDADTGDYQVIYGNTTSVTGGSGKTVLGVDIGNQTKISAYSTAGGDVVTISTPVELNTPTLIQMLTTGQGGTLTLAQDGTDVASGTSGTTDSTGTLVVGSGGSRKYRGKIAEIIHISNTISTATKQKIEGYLAWKWGLYGSLPDAHPYRYNGASFGFGYGSLLFSEDFESPVIAGYTQGQLPDNGNWVGSNDGFGSERWGMNNKASGDWATSTSGDDQAISFKYTNSGAATAVGVVGTININTAKYVVELEVGYDKCATNPPITGSPSGDYRLTLAAMDTGDDRQDFRFANPRGPAAEDRTLTLETGTVANDDETHTVTVEYTTDPTTDLAKAGFDLVVWLDGATSSAVVSNVKVYEYFGV